MNMIVITSKEIIVSIILSSGRVYSHPSFRKTLWTNFWKMIFLRNVKVWIDSHFLSYLISTLSPFKGLYFYFETFEKPRFNFIKTLSP